MRDIKTLLDFNVVNLSRKISRGGNFTNYLAYMRGRCLVRGVNSGILWELLKKSKKFQKFCAYGGGGGAGLAFDRMRAGVLFSELSEYSENLPFKVHFFTQFHSKSRIFHAFRIKKVNFQSICTRELCDNSGFRPKITL